MPDASINVLREKTTSKPRKRTEHTIQGKTFTKDWRGLYGRMPLRSVGTIIGGHEHEAS